MTENTEEPRQSGPSPLTLVIVVVLAVVALIFILSNLEQADFKFLTLTVEMPEWLLFIVLVSLGLLIGWGASAIRYRRKQQELRKHLD